MFLAFSGPLCYSVNAMTAQDSIILNGVPYFLAGTLFRHTASELLNMKEIQWWWNTTVPHPAPGFFPCYGCSGDTVEVVSIVAGG